MLRVIRKPVKNDIYQVQGWIEHLVCEVWCKADSQRCVNKLDTNFRKIYDKYKWLKISINDIYKECKSLSLTEKQLISNAFVANNRIEELCNGSQIPVYLTSLPALVENKMKPLFIAMYEVLLERKSVPGTKMNYYKAIQEENSFANCPCCGYMPFENVFSTAREDLDHFFPKATYPFSSINFNNLSPLCNKCNSDFKGDTDPIENNLQSFYTYQTNETSIKIDVSLDSEFINYAQRVLVSDSKEKVGNNIIKISLTGKEQGKIDRWDELYNIKNRYKDRVETFTYIVLRRLKTKANRLKTGYDFAINFDIEECSSDIYLHEHFIQIPFLESLRPLLV